MLNNFCYRVLFINIVFFFFVYFVNFYTKKFKATRVCFEDFSWDFRGEGHREREMRPRRIPDSAGRTSRLHSNLLPYNTGKVYASLRLKQLKRIRSLFVI